MSNILAGVSGLLLIAFATMIFTYAIPSLSQATTTGVGTAYENASAFTVNAIGTTNMVILVFPGVLFLAGLALVFMGIKGG